MIRTGDTVRIRPVGAQRWVPAKVETIMPNGKALGLSYHEGLGPPSGGLFMCGTHRKVLLLYKKRRNRSYYQELTPNGSGSTEWEVQDAQGHRT